MRRWTPHENATLAAMKAAGASEREIAAALERGVGEVNSHWCYVNLAPGRKAAKLASARRRKISVRAGKPAAPDQIAVPVRALAEREALARARAAQPAIARLLGDPPPGRSALDRREGRAP